MNVSAVIVTYNNRFKLLIQVIESLTRLKINKIIVVDNNSFETSRNQLITLEKELIGKLKVLYLGENTGSAGGYSKGLVEFRADSNSEFVWLLDDDNVPEENSLEILKEFWKRLKVIDKEKLIALLSYRKDRKVYRKAINYDKPDMVFGPKNCFMGFSINEILKKIIKNSSMLEKRRMNGYLPEREYGIVSVAYYGGLFFHKRLLDKISYPNTKFFVYADDIDFSSRINKLGGNIYVLLNSKINDIDDKSQIERSGDSFLKLPVINESNKVRMYYTIRNRIYFEKNSWSKNKFIFKLNKIVYLILLKILFLTKNIKHKELISTAITDGLSGNLGKREFLNLK